MSIAFTTSIEGASAERWHFAAGERSSGEERVSFELFWQEASAAFREFRGDDVLVDTRCDAGAYTSVDYLARHVVVRERSPIRDCMRWATSSMFEAAAVAVEAGLAETSTGMEGGRTIEEFSTSKPDKDLRFVAIDKESGLPRAIVRADGTETRWSYSTIGIRSGPPSLVIPDAAGGERYRALTRSEASDRLRLDSLPSRVGQFEYLEAMSYHTDDGSEAGTTYAFWRRRDGGEIQLVRGTGVVASEELGVTDLGGTVVFKAQHGDDYVYVAAPDRKTLSLAIPLLDSASP